ncbi:conserved hypothetical protein [Tenacibaculum litopenaei]|uniref:SDR family NAD(P)-dependent oxidoreductase n=1 Tax=Tenacibaculum litopenaei TaxID=396016 RepID=UPI0038933AB2
MKNIIVTGCSRGIGLAIAARLVKKSNVKVIGTSTSGKCELNAHNFNCLSLDVSSPKSISDFVSELQGIKIDLLINNAGILLEDWGDAAVNFQQLRQTFDVNLFGTIELTEKLLPQMNSEAHIVNITSDWGSFSEQNFDAFQPHYKMSKAALNMYTKLLAKRFEHRLIVSAFDPGWTQTDMGGHEASRTPAEVAMDMEQLIERVPESGHFWHRGNIREW